MILLWWLAAVVTVLACAGIVAARALRHRSAALRHVVLAASLGGIALAPVAGATLPAWAISPLWVPRADPRATPAADRQRAIATTSLPTTVIDEADARQPTTLVASSVFAIWVGGALVSLSVLALSVYRVRRTTRAGSPLDDDRWRQRLTRAAAGRGCAHVTLRVVTDLPTPATWGARQPCILLPPDAADWGDAEAHVVLAHELAHVARRDWALQLGAELVRAVYWWHPLVRHLASRLRTESELACDDRVLAAGVAPCDYAARLVVMARAMDTPARATVGLLAMAHPRQLERRIRAMLTHAHDRRPLSRRHALAVIVAAGVLTSAVATVRTQPSQADLRGTVYDSSGAVVPEVTLTLVRDDDTRLEAFTRADGSFSFPGIAAGTHTLEAALPGFQKLSETFTLANAGDWDRAITLQLGTLQETINIVADRTTTSAAAQGPTQTRVGGNIRVPRKLKDVRAVYPPAMRAEGREGEVTLEAIIDTDGAVQSVRVLGAHVHPDFALAAADAVRQWQFSPTLLNGQPVEVRMNVAMSFRLDSAGQ